MWVAPLNGPFTVEELIARGLSRGEAAWLVYEPAPTLPNPADFHPACHGTVVKWLKENRR